MKSLLLYEDCKDDDLQKLLLYHYQNRIHCDFSHADGACSLEAKIQENYNHYDCIAVYIDVSPGNLNTYAMYRNLAHKFATNLQCKVIILPIFGAEYYFIKSLYYLEVLQDPELLKVIMGTKSHLDYLSSQKLSNPSKCFSFERFCKWILKDKVYPCIAQKLPNNFLKGVFYSQDCEYTFGGRKLTLEAKSLAYLQEYPIVPGIELPNYKSLTIEDIKRVHRTLVDKYNSYTKCMQQSCTVKQLQNLAFIDYAY